MDQNPEGQDRRTSANPQQPTSLNGAIFSSNATSANLTPNSNLPTQPAPDSNHPFFAHHPSHTFSSEMGDIVVGSKPRPKRRKKIAIIAGIIGILILIIIMIIIVVQLNDRQYTSTRLEVFSRYASYISTGSLTSDNLNQSLKSPYSSYLVTAVQSGDIDFVTDVFTDAQSLLEDFAQTYHQDGSTDDLVNSLISINRNQLDALRVYSLTEYSDSVIMTALYIGSGPDQMYQSVTNAYGAMANSQNTILNSIGNGKIQIANYLITVLDYYKSQGCIFDDTLQDSCVSQLEVPEEIYNINNQLTVLENEVIELERQLIINVFSSCQNMLYTLTPSTHNVPDNVEEIGVMQDED